MLLLLGLQVASDRTGPVTSIATVEGLGLPIASRIQGELLSVPVRDNQIVEPGDVLAEFVGRNEKLIGEIGKES